MGDTYETPKDLLWPMRGNVRTLRCPYCRSTADTVGFERRGVWPGTFRPVVACRGCGNGMRVYRHGVVRRRFVGMPIAEDTWAQMCEIWEREFGEETEI